MGEKDGVAVIGGGGHAKVILSILQLRDRPILGVFDDNTELEGSEILGVPVLGPVNRLKAYKPSSAVIAIGDNKTRKRIAESRSLEWDKVIHPFSWIHHQVPIGEGTVVCAGAIVQPGAKIGNHVILNTRAGIDHDCQIGDFVHIASAHLAGGVSIEEGGFLGVGSTIFPYVNVGAWATVGAGSFANRDVPEGTTVIGVPARIFKK